MKFIIATVLNIVVQSKFDWDDIFEEISTANKMYKD